MSMTVTTTLMCDERGCDRKVEGRGGQDTARRAAHRLGWQVSAEFARSERELMDLCPEHRALPEPSEETRKTCLYCGQPANNGVCQRSHP